MSKVPIPEDLELVVSRALTEDVGSGDITAELIEANLRVGGRIIGKESGVLCGVPWAERTFQQLARTIDLDWLVAEGEEFAAGQTIVSIAGEARPIMTGERTALNFLQTLSGTATQTRSLVNLVSHTGVTLLDTRKTLPGLRTAQKYAVRIGGAKNHRMGLYDAFLIKENHIVSCGGIGPAIDRAKSLYPGKSVEIEVQSLAELETAISAGADVVMLDNFDLDTVKEAVRINAKRAKLEASGGIDEVTLVSIAETGVDYISIGALTKNLRAIDLSLLID